MRTEHQNLLKLLHSLQTQMGVFAEGQKPNFDLVQDILDYITNFFERFHHGKEEIMLLKLQQRLPDLESGLSETRQEHEQLSKLTHELVATIDDIVVDSNLISRESVAKLATDFINSNREHIKHEEQFIFPLALNQLKEKDWRDIAASIPASDDPLFGKEVQQQYQTLYRTIIEQSISTESP